MNLVLGLIIVKAIFTILIVRKRRNLIMKCALYAVEF